MEISEQELARCRKIANAICWHSGAQHLAEDAEQEAVIGLIKAKQVFDPSRNDDFSGFSTLYISGYVRTFLRNQWYDKRSDHHCKGMVYADHLPDDVTIDALLKPAIPASEWEEKISVFQEMRIMWSKIAALPAEQRDTIIRYFWLDQGPTTIGRQTHARKSVVYYRLNAALKKLAA
jgi:RNA polymerase sigma factor (sigma-70 family)